METLENNNIMKSNKLCFKITFKFKHDPKRMRNDIKTNTIVILLTICPPHLLRIHVNNTVVCYTHLVIKCNKVK